MTDQRSTARLPEILEAEFGEIETGYKVTGFPDVQIIKYQTGTIGRISTLGLHRWHWGENKVRFEWLAECPLDRSIDRLANALDDAVQCLLSGRINLPTRGSWISLPQHIWPEVDSTALYFTSPAMSDQLISFCESELIVLCTVIPISDAEVGVLEAEGWPALEERWKNAM